MRTSKQKIKMFLAKPDKTRIAKLHFLENKNLVHRTDAVNELTFTVPYFITVDGKKEKNPHYDLIKEKYLIYTEFKGVVEWFTIDDKDKDSGEKDSINVTCYSLGYQLNYQLLIGYEATGYNCKMITDDILRNTDWKTGYINTKFNLKYRRYDFSSTTKLSAIYEVGKTLDAIPVFDTVEKTVNFYDKEELSKYKGFNIGYGKYIQNIQEKTSASEIVTRLYVYGSDGLTINSVNPTGQSYIDDFSYFLYPFELDRDGEVINSSDYMSDGLAKSLVKYNNAISDRKTDFSKLLSDKSELQKELTKEKNKLHELDTELKIILDDISINKDIGASNTQNNQKRDKKNNEINKKKADIKKIEDSIKDIDDKISKLKNDLKEDKFFTPKQLEELSNFIHEDEWTDDNHFDVNDLYEAGFEQLKKVNEPPVNITTSLVNFMQMLSEKHNWDRFDVWDIIRINHDRLGIDIKVHISEISFAFNGEESISVTIVNENKKVSMEEKFENTLYIVHKTNTDYNKRKINWERIAYNFNIRNDRIEKKPENPKSTTISHKANDDGSVNIELEWDFPEFSKTKKDEHNIDGFLIYLYPSDVNEPYQFGSAMSKETIVDVSLYSKSYVFPSLPSNLYYTVGVQAYRRVDDDINTEGIIQSDIVNFVDKKKIMTKSITPFSTSVVNTNEDEEFRLSDPYQPSKNVNFKGSINGVFLTSKNIADVGQLSDGHLIYDEETRQWMIWDAGENVWKNTHDSEELRKELEENKKYVEEIMSEVDRELEEMNKELDKELELLEKEMKHLEEEVIPDVEKAVEETKIPEYTSNPDEIPPSGLYWDISVSPPRMKRWDDENSEWTNLAPNEKEIGDLMEKMRQEAVAESTTYSRADTLKVRKNIEDKINNEIIKIQDDIGELLEIKDELIETADKIDELLDEYDGKFTDFEHRVDEVEGKVSTTITDIERIDGVVEGHTSSIEQNAASIEQKVSSVEYERDKTGILSNIESNETAINQLSSEIELRVTKEEFENGMANTSTANLISSLPDVWEQGGYDSNVNPIDDGNKSKIRMNKNKQALLSSNTEYTLSSELIKLYTGITFNLKVWRVYIGTPDNLADIRYESIVNNEEFDEDGKITFTTGNPTYENAPSVDLDFCSIIVEISASTAVLDLQYLDNLQLMLNKGTTAQPFQPHSPDIIERISKSEATLNIHSDAIELKAEKSELENYVDKQVYNNKIGELDVAIDNITGRVESTEVDFNDFKTGDYNTFKQQYGEFKLEMDNFTTKVGELSSIDGTLIDSFSEIKQEVGSIESTVQDVRVDVNGLEDEMSAMETTIKQLPDQINLSVKEGIDLIELGGTNLVLDSEEIKSPNNTFSAWYLTDRFFKEYSPEDNYIISFEAKADTSNEILRVYTNMGDIRTQGLVDLTTNWKRYEVPANFAGLEFERIAFHAGGFSGATSFQGHIRKVKIEKGNKATDWSPAPEDGVSKTNVLSSINLSTEGVKIEGSKIDIKGVAEFMSSNVNLLPMHPSNWENGYITIGGVDTSRDTSARTIDYISVLPDTEYTINNIKGASLYIREYEEDKFVNNHTTLLAVGNSRTFTTGANSKYLRIYWNNPNVNKILMKNIGINYQATLVEGSTPLSWEDAKTTIINGGRIVTNNITANQLNVNEIFGNSAIIAEIQSGAIKTAKLDATQIDTGTLNAARIGAQSITTTKLAANAVTANKINAGAVNADKLAANAVTANKIAAKAVTTAKIAAGAVTADEISVDRLDALTGNLGTITSGTINANRVIINNKHIVIDNNGLKIMRPDGVPWVENGTVNHDFSISGFDPPLLDRVVSDDIILHGSPPLEPISGFYFGYFGQIDGRATPYQPAGEYNDIRDADKGYTINVQRYEFIHTARYFVLGYRVANNGQVGRHRVRLYNGGTSNMLVDLELPGGNTSQTYHAIVADLGSPNFQRKSVDFRIGSLRQWGTGSNMYRFRVNRVYLTDNP